MGLRKIDSLVTADISQESYAIVWALWRAFDSTVVGTALTAGVALGLFADALVHGMLSSCCEWRAVADEERHLQMALGRGLPASALRTLWLQGEADYVLHAPLVFESMYHVYQKLSKCLDYVTVNAHPSLGSSYILGQIESFGQGIGQWLKVAGGSKVSITEGALQQRRPQEHEVSAEFGAFVGYSGIRFARCILAAAETTGT